MPLRKTIPATGAAALILLMLCACAAPASADPLSMNFTEARANVGVQLSDAALFEAPDVAPLEAQIDPGSGSIADGALQVPQFATHITAPIDADVTVDFDIGVITGSFTQASGALSLAGEAGGTLASEGEECTVSTEPAVLTLSTAGSSGGTSPRSGASFASGLTGPGAIAGQWTDMIATPVDSGDPENVSFCNNVQNRIGGAGGIWLEQKGSVVPPPQPPTDQGGGNQPPPPPPACIVPKLRGKTLARAKAALKHAHCTLGTVRKPKRLAGKKLVVKSSSPGVGAKPANGKVHLKLGPKPQAHR